MTAAGLRGRVGTPRSLVPDTAPDASLGTLAAVPSRSFSCPSMPHPTIVAHVAPKPTISVRATWVGEHRFDTGRHGRADRPVRRLGQDRAEPGGRARERARDVHRHRRRRHPRQATHAAGSAGRRRACRAAGRSIRDESSASGWTFVIDGAGIEIAACRARRRAGDREVLLGGRDAGDRRRRRDERRRERDDGGRSCSSRTRRAGARSAPRSGVAAHLVPAAAALPFEPLRQPLSQRLGRAELLARDPPRREGSTPDSPRTPGTVGTTAMCALSRSAPVGVICSSR